MQHIQNGLAVRVYETHARMGEAILCNPFATAVLASQTYSQPPRHALSAVLSVQTANSFDKGQVTISTFIPSSNEPRLCCMQLSSRGTLQNLSSAWQCCGPCTAKGCVPVAALELPQLKSAVSGLVSVASQCR